MNITNCILQVNY